MYQYFLAPIIGFLFGSLPFSWLIVKIATGKDIRKEGSGSVSARNSARAAGYFWAILASVLDITKGFLAVFITRFFLAPTVAMGSVNLSILCTALAGIGAFAGHLWMPWMKFKGGKGFAVLLGSMIVINPYGTLVWVISILLFLIIFRYSYIAGLAATISVAVLDTLFFIFTVPNIYWSSWAVLIHGWSCVVILVLRLIPDFKAMKRGDIKRWSGMKVSQWMK